LLYLNLLEDGRAERTVRAERATALHGLRELIGLAKILLRIRIIGAIVETALGGCTSVDANAPP
jgi:hypothetical protein